MYELPSATAHKHRPNKLPCGPLESNKNKDALINSLNVFLGGERYPRAAMHPCVQGSEDGHSL